MDSRLLAGALLIIAAALIVGCTNAQPQATPTPPPGTPPAGTPAPIPVDIRGFAFNPASLPVHVGDTVTWTNNDGATHTITSDAGTELSHTLAPGESWSHTFTQAGTYAYHCSIHSSMRGTVTVMP